LPPKGTQTFLSEMGCAADMVSHLPCVYEPEISAVKTFVRLGYPIRSLSPLAFARSLSQTGMSEPLWGHAIARSVMNVFHRD